MLYRWCVSCGHQSMEVLWLEFREITFYHYTLSISTEMTVHLCYKCCFPKLPSYCAFTCTMIDSLLHTFFHKDYSPSIFHESLWKKGEKQSSHYSFLCSFFYECLSPMKLFTFLTNLYRILHTSGV